MSPRRSTPRRTPDPARWFGRFALAATAGLICLMAVRTLIEEDLGYHLAFGEMFWATGEPVETFVPLYTLRPMSDAAATRPEPGPGCWYGPAGRYRFVNANWLTQALLYPVYREGGFRALSGLLAGLVLGIMALLALAMWRLGLRPLGIAAVLALLTAATYDRWQLRPELMGYFVLAGQLAILSRFLVRPADAVRWRDLLGLVALQVLFVNLHGYFLLGLAATGAVTVGALARWRSTQPGELRTRTGRNARRLAGGLGGQVLACLANPWTWRGAILPIETILYLRTHRISDPQSGHPWSAAEELHPTELLTGPWDLNHAALLVALAVVVGGLAGALLRRRLGVALLTAGFAMVVFSARRNIAVGLLVALPFAAAGLRAGLADVMNRRPAWVRQFLAVMAAVVVMCFTTLLYGSVISNRFYYAERRPVRYGAGASAIALPMGPAAWLNEHTLRGRLWADPAVSSNIYFLLQPHPPINFITNTWAYPPEIMQRVLQASGAYGEVPFALTVSDYDVSVVLARQYPLLRAMAKSKDFTLAYVDGPFALFVRTTGPDRHLLLPDLARLSTPEQYIARAKAMDTRPAEALWLTGRTLLTVGRARQARPVLAEAVRIDPRHGHAWNTLGQAWFVSARLKQARRDVTFRDDLIQARRAFEQALLIEPDLLPAAQGIEAVQAWLDQLGRDE